MRQAVAHEGFNFGPTFFTLDVFAMLASAFAAGIGSLQGVICAGMTRRLYRLRRRA